MKLFLRIFLISIVFVCLVIALSFVRSEYLLNIRVFQDLVRIRKYLESMIVLSPKVDKKDFLKSAIYQYKDTFSDGDIVNVFQGRFIRMDLDNGVLWLKGDNLVEYGFIVTDKSLSFVSVRGKVPEETVLTSYSLAGGLLREGEFIKIFWNDPKIVRLMVKDWELQQNVVNQNTHPVYRIEKYENQ